MRRAREFSPFLRDAASALPQIAESFSKNGSAEAVSAALDAEADGVEEELRRKRLGLALAVALGDLSGELSFEQATRALSDFADLAIERALSAAFSERVPEAELRGIAVIALGKLGSRELN